MGGKGLIRGFRCLNCTFKGPAVVQQRLFATSPVRQKHGAVPAFSPTSNSELDGLLASLRNKLFMPNHLSRSQQDLIYQEKHERMLKIEPVFAEIQGERFQLEHIDKTKDVPGGRKSLSKAMRLMEGKDWDNLPSLLHGLRNAKNHILPEEEARIARKAGKAGRPDVILECARRVSDTGFRLGNLETIAELLWQIQDRAFKSDWAARETKQALAWAEMASEMLEDPRHAGHRAIQGPTDPRIRPEVIGTLLQLSAVWATRYYDGEDRDGKVARYTARLLGSAFDIAPENGAHHEAINIYLAHMVPVLHGMKLAGSILRPGSRTALEEKTLKLEEVIIGQREKLLDLPNASAFRGLAVYDRLIGPKAKQVVSTARRHKETERA